MALSIVPIMFDLGHEESGRVTVGPGTKKACDAAIRLASGTASSVILLTATVPPSGKYGTEPMGRVAETYIRQAAPTLTVRFREAGTFNTLGEVVAVADYLKDECGTGAVVFTVKWWHAPRVLMIALRVFRKRGLAMPVRIKPHWHPLSLKLFLREIGSFAANWRRIDRM